MKNDITPSRVSVTYRGFCVDLAQEIGKVAGIAYKLQTPSDGKYEKIISSGDWNGMIGDLINERADIALADLTINKDRMDAVDFSVPFMNTGVSILYTKSGQIANGIYSVEDMLRNSSNIKFGWVKGGSTHQFLSTSTVPTMRQIWRRHAHATLNSNKDGMERVMRDNGTFAFLMEQKSLEYYTQNNCGLVQIGGLLNERNYAIAMAKGKNLKYKPTKVWKDKVGACIKGRNNRASHGWRGSSLANCKKTCEDETSFNCRSIDYASNEGICHWNEDNKASAGRDYQERCHAPYYIYSELVQENQELPLLPKINEALMTMQQSGKLQELKDKWWGGNSTCGDNQPRQNGQNMWGIQIPQSLAQQLRTLLMNIMKPPRSF